MYIFAYYKQSTFFLIRKYTFFFLLKYKSTKRIRTLFEINVKNIFSYIQNVECNAIIVTQRKLIEKENKKLLDINHT